MVDDLFFSYPKTPHDTGIQKSVVLYCGNAKTPHCVGSKEFSLLLAGTKNTIFVSFTAFSQRKSLLSPQLDSNLWNRLHKRT